MHRIIGASAVVAGMIVVGLVARYGYVSSGAPASGAVVALIFALFAIGGLVDPAIAVYLWQRSRAGSIFVGFLALVALGATLSITLRAVQERYDEPPVELYDEPPVEPVPEPDVEPIKVFDPYAEDRDALDRIQRELAGLRDYEMITAAVVEAAKTAAAAAKESREAACSSSRSSESNPCRQRESDERQALAAVEEAKKNRAATERVNALRVERAMIQMRLADAPKPVIETPRTEETPSPVIETPRTEEASTPVIKTPRAEAAPPKDLQTEVAEHTPLFRFPNVTAVTAATWQKFALAAFLELLIAFAFVALALMRPKACQPAATSPKPMPKMHGRGLARGRHLSALTPTRKVYEYVVDRLEERGGTAVPFSDVYLDYEAWCQHHRAPPLTPYDFTERIKQVFKGTDVFTRERNDIIQLVNVRFAGSL